MNRTKTLLEQKRPIFDNSLDILLKEEILWRTISLSIS